MRKSEHETVRLLLIEAHYETLGDQLSWNAERFRKLAEAAHMTVFELGAVFRLTTTETARYLRQDQFPATVELHLTLFSRFLLPSSGAPVFPPEALQTCSSTSTS